jgi:signal peptidase II
MTKWLYLEYPVQWSGSFYRFRLLKNFGFMLGSLKDADPLVTVVSSVTLGFFLLFLYFIFIYLMPSFLSTFKIGLSIFIGSAMGNVIDRLRLGYVVDFLQLKMGTAQTGIFNIADSTQFVGIAILLFGIVINAKRIWHDIEIRRTKWIDPEFQWRYCLTLTGISLAFVVVIGAFFYSFLKVSMRNSPFPVQATTMNTFLVSYSMLSACLLLVIAFVGRQLSHKISGPIYAFEKYLEGLLKGEMRKLKFREGDEFKRLEIVADQFYNFFESSLSIGMMPIEAKQQAPLFSATTYDQKTLNLSDYHGKKVWLAVFRYATCPLCTLYLHEMRKNFDKLNSDKFQILAVFESKPDDFLKDDTGKTQELLQSLPFPLISDPDRKIYRKYKTKRSIWSLFSPKTYIRLLNAQREGFAQGSIDGNIGQIPAHFLINENGNVAKAYYGKSITDNIPWDEIQKFSSL